MCPMMAVSASRGSHLPRYGPTLARMPFVSNSSPVCRLEVSLASWTGRRWSSLGTLQVTSAVSRKSKYRSGSSSKDSEDGVDKRLMSPEDQEFWRDLMQRIEKPELQKFLSKLDPTHPIGIRKGSTTRTSDEGKAPAVKLYEYFMDLKMQYPRSMILVRFGDFYQCYGFDALLLCQFANVNAMNSSLEGIVCSGVPVQNMPGSVRHLNAANISVVVCNEVQGGGYGQKKDRFIMGVSTPAHPIIFVEGGTSEEYYVESAPIIGITCGKNGLVFFEYKHELQTVHVTEQLTLEALSCWLQARRAAPPLLLHRMLFQISLPNTSFAAVDRAIKSQVGPDLQIKHFGSAMSTEPLQEFINEVKTEMNMNADTQIDVCYPARSLQGRPQPPYLPTITNLGLNKTSGMPNLMDLCLVNYP